MPNEPGAPSTYQEINFGELVECCFDNDGLFARMRVEGIQQPLHDIGRELNQTDYDGVAPRLEGLSDAEAGLYNWLFENTGPEGELVVEGGYSYAGPKVSWP